MQETPSCIGPEFSYNISAGVLGGTTPLICASLMDVTHDRMAPAFHLMGAAVIGLFLLSAKWETAHKPLN